MLKILKRILPFFISFPSYLALYTSLIFISQCAQYDSPLSGFIWTFNVVNSIFGIPLLAGIFTDSIGVLNMLPVYDIFFILGQIILYLAFSNRPNGNIKNEPLALVGLFFTCVVYSLKDTSRLVYLANTFIVKKRDGDYDIREFSTQNVAALASRYLILAAVFFFYKPWDICKVNMADLALLCLGFACFGLIASILLIRINNIEIKRQREDNEHNGLTKAEEGNVFLEYNNRIDQSEDDTPTLVVALRTIFKDKRMSFVKYWLVGAACLVTLGTLYITKNLYPQIPSLFPSLQFVMTILLFWIVTEKRIRVLTIITGLFLTVYQVYVFYETGPFDWIMVLVLPMALLFTDIYMPYVFDFDISYLGITVGIKKWIENFLLLFATLSHAFGSSVDPYLYFQFGLAAVGLLLILIFNVFYVKSKVFKNRTTIREPLLNANNTDGQIKID